MGKAPVTGNSLKCTINADFTTSETFKDIGTQCTFNYACAANANLRGKQDILFELPFEFQWIDWSIIQTKWNTGKEHVPMNTSSILSSNSSLYGTQDDPTTLTFGVIRSSYNDETDSKKNTTFGIQLFWRGTTKKLIPAENTGTHFVAFRLEIEENVYISKKLTKNDTSSMISVLIAYTLTALSVLGISKQYVQVFVDKILQRNADKKNKRPPHDVLRRQTVLQEHAITKRAGRRISTVFHDDLKKDKKGDKDKNIETISTEIELTTSKDQNGNVEFSNPMQGKGKGKKKRRPSAAFELPPPSPRRRGDVEAIASMSATSATSASNTLVEKMQKEIMMLKEDRKQQTKDIIELKKKEKVKEKEINELKKKEKVKEKEINELKEAVAKLIKVSK